jgi:hypothetical protein
MGFTLLSLFVAFIIRLPALYVSLTQVGYFRLSKGTLITLAMFSTLLGVIMPAAGIDVVGVMFRIALLAVIVMVVMRSDIMDALKAVVVAAFIESIILLALSLSPVSFLVAGLGFLSVP